LGTVPAPTSVSAVALVAAAFTAVLYLLVGFVLLGVAVSVVASSLSTETARDSRFAVTPALTSLVKVSDLGRRTRGATRI
jgi:hypothetical protein